MTPAEREGLLRAACSPGALLTDAAFNRQQAHALVALIRLGAVVINRDDPPRILGVKVALLDWSRGHPPRTSRPYLGPASDSRPGFLRW